MNNNILELRTLINGEGNRIAFDPIYMRITKNANAAIMLAQLVYWCVRKPNGSANDGPPRASLRKKDREGEHWLTKSNIEWEAETGLTYQQQRTARRILKTLNILIEEDGGNFGKRTLWFRLDYEQLLKLWAEKL